MMPRTQKIGLSRMAVALSLASCPALALCPTPALAQESGFADLVITNGHVFTTGTGTPADASVVAIRGNVIVAVGPQSIVARWRGPATRVIDAGGRAVLPGFDDNHVHLSMGAKSLAYPDVRSAPGLPAIQAMVRAQAQAKPDAAWVELGGWLPLQLPGNRPHASMLDAVVSDRPVILWTLDRHGAWVNSKGLAALGITDGTPNPVNGIIDRDAQGHATGWLKEFGAITMIEAVMPRQPDAEREALLGRALAEAHRYGITSLTEALGTPEEYLLLDDMRKHGKLDMRITYAMVALPGISEARIHELTTFWKAHPDTDRLRTGTVKIFLDGVPQSGTAFMLHPWGPQATDGEPAWKPADYARAAKVLDRDGWELMVHAMGDGAVRLALDGMEGAMKANPARTRERRFRIEHAYLVDPADYGRFVAMNVTAAYQPIDNFRPSDAPALPADAARAPQDNGRWTRMRALGGRYGFGSDFPVSSLDALARIYTVANGVRGDQRMPPEQMIVGYTASNAYLDFAETKRGRIAPGQLADLAIVSSDILSHPPEKAQDIRIDATIFDGKPVYVRPGSGIAGDAPASK